MTLRTRYNQFPVAVKLVSVPLIVFLSLWTLGAIGLGYFARNYLAQTAYQETSDLAVLLQQDLQQKERLLSLKARWVSEERSVVDAVSTSDRTLLLRTLLPIQSALELDLLRIVDTNGQSLLSSQQRSLDGVQFQDAIVNATAKTGLEVSGILLPDNTAPCSLVSFFSIKSATTILANLVVGIAIDDALLQQIRGNTSMHLVAFQGDRVTASTLMLKRDRPWSFPQANASPQRIEIAGEIFLSKTVELPSFDGQALQIAVLKSFEETEQAERKLWCVVAIFGFLGGVLIVGVMLLGFRVTQALSRRIQSLTQATQALAQGDLTIRLQTNTQDEVGVLAQGFNTMAEQLTLRDRQLSQHMQQLESTLEELHRTQGQMVQSEKMSALGQMVAGVAHEINNPVNFIHGNLSYIEQYLQDLLKIIHSYQHHYPHPSPSLQAELEEAELDFLVEDLQKILKSMKVGSDRIRNIVISLRNFSRLDEAEFKLADLHEGIDNTLMILQHRLKAQSDAPAIEVIKNYGQLPLVECYPGYLNQVFMNLLANAIDALEEAAQKKTREERHIQPGIIWISTQQTTDDWAKIMIADNGLGMSQPVRSRIFDPFFTTKPIGKGTGLGLPISYQIVTEKHNGKLECDSTPQKGTQFVIHIPIRQPDLNCSLVQLPN
ncbi:MAG: HAMP domain-containing protein [Desertifilum sp. SIO1I2]|nr:HAMP domain-containing protein [Desertifilum sp. SIO1I2]